MTNELVKILEEAKRYYYLSNRWFETYTESLNQLDWEMVGEMRATANGLLKAYEIMTGKKVYSSEIDKELAIYALA